MENLADLEELADVGAMMTRNGFDSGYMSIISDVFWPCIFQSENQLSSQHFFFADPEYIKLRNEQTSIKTASSLHSRLNNFFDLPITFDDLVYLGVGYSKKHENPDFSLLLSIDSKITKYFPEFSHYDAELDQCYLPKSKMLETPARVYFLVSSAAYGMASRYLHQTRSQHEEISGLISPPFLDHRFCFQVQNLMIRFIFPEEDQLPEETEILNVIDSGNNILNADCLRRLDDDFCIFWAEMVQESLSRHS